MGEEKEDALAVDRGREALRFVVVDRLHRQECLCHVERGGEGGVKPPLHGTG